MEPTKETNKTEIDLQTQRTDWRLPKGDDQGRKGEIGEGEKIRVFAIDLGDGYPSVYTCQNL